LATAPDLICEIDFPGNGTWTDVTSYVESSAFSIQHGRPNEQQQCSPGTMAFTLNNNDGRFTAGLASSPYYPNVKLARPVRLRASWVPGKNYLQNPGFEDPRFITDGPPFVRYGPRFGVWRGNSNSAIPDSLELSRDTTHVLTGTYALLVFNDTASAATNCTASQTFGGLTVGSTYTAQATIYQTTGSTSVGIEGVGDSATTSTVNAWTQISYTFVATSRYHVFRVWNHGLPGGQGFWIDSAQVESGSSATSVDLVGATHSGRFYGYTGGWPTTFDGNAAKLSYVSVVATDLLGRLSRGQLGTQVSEQIKLDYQPEAYFPLDASQGSVTAANMGTNSNIPALTVTSTGVAGSVDFGNEMNLRYFGDTSKVTAPGATFTNGTDWRNLKYLMSAPLDVIDGTANGYSMSCFFKIDALPVGYHMLVMAARSTNGDWVEIKVTPTGLIDVWRYFASTNSQTIYANSSSVVDTTVGGNGTRVAVGERWNGTSYDAYLSINGALEGGVTTNATTRPFIMDQLFVGGRYENNLAPALPFKGTISHAAFAARPPQQRISSTVTAFDDGGVWATVNKTLQSPGASIQYLLGYYLGSAVGTVTDPKMIGVHNGLTTLYSLAPDMAGKSHLTAMQEYERAEQGVVFADGDGLLSFHSRNLRWDTTGITYGSLPAGTWEAVVPTLDDVYLINSQRVASTLLGDVLAKNNASIGAYGEYKGNDITALFKWTTEDNILRETGMDSIAKAIVTLYAEPISRINSVKLELITQPELFPTILPIEVSSGIYLNGMPSQAPTTSADCIVEGWQESISVDTWEITFNTSPASLVKMFTFDDATYGILDTDNLIAF
jgi:hypothetical protein